MQLSFGLLWYLIHKTTISKVFTRNIATTMIVNVTVNINRLEKRADLEVGLTVGKMMDVAKIMES